MGIEQFTDTAPDELNVDLPASGDSRTEGDNHLRNIKNVIKTTFANVSGPVTASEAELNYVDITALGTWQAGKALTAAVTSGAIECSSLAMSNINIDSGDITGVSYAGGTVTGSLTWNAAQDLNSQALDNVNIDSGNIASAVVLADGITATTQVSSDDSTKLATTAFAHNLDGAITASSIAANGYIKLGNLGLAIQWNRLATSSTSGTVTFPVAFNAAPYSIAISDQLDGASAGATTNTVITGNPTSTQFSWSTQAAVDYLCWIAIGPIT